MTTCNYIFGNDVRKYSYSVAGERSRVMPAWLH